MTRVVVMCVMMVIASGCGDAPSGDGGDVDSTLVDVLADLHLADARAALDSSDSARLGDSLRAQVRQRHDLDSTALADRLDRLADDPARLRATYDAVDSRLGLERQGIK